MTRWRWVWAAAALSVLGGADFETVQAADSEAAWEAFDNSLYTFCDVTLLSDHWGKNLEQTKVGMGEALVEKGAKKGRNHLNDELAQARTGKPDNFCAFDDSEYENADAVDLAVLWDIEVGEAKKRVERLLLKGKNKRIAAALKKARANAPDLSKQASTETAAVAEKNAPLPPPTSKTQRQSHLFICLDEHYPQGLPIGKHTISIRLSADEFGAVVTADMEKTTFTNEAAVQCMLNYAKTWRFAVPEKGPRTLRIHRFNLTFESSAG